MQRSVRLFAAGAAAFLLAGGAAAASILGTSTAQAATTSGGVKFAYFTQWGIYVNAFYPKTMDVSGDASKIDFIQYAFENISPTTHTCFEATSAASQDESNPNAGDGAGDQFADYEKSYGADISVDGVGDVFSQPLAGNFNQLKKLKVKYPNLKVLVSLGGWTYSKYFSDVAATDASRKKFVASCIDTWIKGNIAPYGGAGGPGTAAGIFDGIDIDWEWPGSPDGHPGNHWSPNDKNNLTALLAEFRAQLDAYGATTGKRYQLHAFTPADPAKVAAGWDLSRVFTYLDVANVQGYDFHGSGSDNSWEPNRTGHQANLLADPADPYPFHFTVESAIKLYTDAGVNPRKLTIGLPFYGRGWQAVADGGKHG